MNDLYKRIESLCKRDGINITVMCKESGASRGSLTDLKMGRVNSLNTVTLSKIAKYFNVPVDYFLGDEKTAAQEGSGLTDTQRALIEITKRLTDAEAAALLAAAQSLEAGHKDQGAE